MQADISAFERLQSQANPQNEFVSICNESVWEDEGIRLIRLPVRWHITAGENGRFDVYEVEGNDSAYRENFPSLEEAKLFVERRKARLQ